MPLWYVFYRDHSLRMGWRNAKEAGGWLGELMAVKMANVDETEVYLEDRIVEVGQRMDVNS